MRVPLPAAKTTLENFIWKAKTQRAGKVANWLD